MSGARKLNHNRNTLLALIRNASAAPMVLYAAMLIPTIPNPYNIKPKDNGLENPIKAARSCEGAIDNMTMITDRIEILRLDVQERRNSDMHSGKNTKKDATLIGLRNSYISNGMQLFDAVVEANKVCKESHRTFVIWVNIYDESIMVISGQPSK